MKRGKGGIEYEDLSVGSGEAATREHKAKVACSLALHRGQQVQELDNCWIDLKRRSTIAGVRYGIEGMQVGGLRRVVIPPQLGYGAKGAPGAGIPASVMLICELRLLELAPTHPIRPTLKLARERKARGESRPE